MRYGSLYSVEDSPGTEKVKYHGNPLLPGLPTYISVRNEWHEEK